MPKVLNTVILTFALAVSTMLPKTGEAWAQVRKDVSEFAGERCNTPPRGSGVVVGQFSGVDDSPFVSGGDGRVPITRFRCFASMEECKGWLYTMQSKYSNAGPPSLVRCDVR
ncbi:hypothetical protein ACFOLL_05620 [Falsochrobactrum ovis]|uniref:Uncharacterized protein n=1 Tax=Falsochrobactrum ovis TaxID=1293442 RepID=A0A364K059_9HYPH|nr:hypothetical protein [Falsochrobactrum ovis]RAK34343.1 hypothetical protein C7374_101677 [Falsochrobactrum ovis]